MSNISNNLIVVSYNGTVSEHSNMLVDKSIVYQSKKLQNSKDKKILVSLKETIYEDNLKSVTSMVKHLDRLNTTLGISISIVDYSLKIYPLLEKATKRSKIKLFKNMTAAQIFLDPKVFKKGMRILVYDKSELNSQALSKELSRYGYTVVRAKSLEEFETLNKDKQNHDIVITHSALNMDSTNSNLPKNALGISKKLIVNLPVFMDTAVETLVSFTGLKAEKSAHGIKMFDTGLDQNIICAVMCFSGDLEGNFTLVFPRDITVIALESLLGESVDEDDTETLQDGVGEFCNIITGSIKTVFSKKDINITFDLPKKYTSLEQTDAFIGHNNGIWIDMQLESKPFYMFITK